MRDQDHQFFKNAFVQLLACGGLVANPKYDDAACSGDLGNEFHIQLRFEPGPASYMYDALSVRITNRQDEVIGETSLSLYDHFTRKQVNHPNFPDGITPIIITKTDRTSWYGAYIEVKDFENLYEGIRDFCSMIREQQQNTDQNSSFELTL